MPTDLENIILNCSPEKPTSLNPKSNFLLPSPHPIYLLQPLSPHEQQTYNNRSINYMPPKQSKPRTLYKWNVDIQSADKIGDFDQDGNFLYQKSKENFWVIKDYDGCKYTDIEMKLKMQKNELAGKEIKREHDPSFMSVDVFEKAGCNFDDFLVDKLYACRMRDGLLDVMKMNKGASEENILSSSTAVSSSTKSGGGERCDEKVDGKGGVRKVILKTNFEILSSSDDKSVLGAVLNEDIAVSGSKNCNSKDGSDKSHSSSSKVSEEIKKLESNLTSGNKTVYNEANTSPRIYKSKTNILQSNGKHNNIVKTDQNVQEPELKKTKSKLLEIKKNPDINATGKSNEQAVSNKTYSVYNPDYKKTQNKINVKAKEYNKFERSNKNMKNHTFPSTNTNSGVKNVQNISSTNTPKNTSGTQPKANEDTSKDLPISKPSTVEPKTGNEPSQKSSKKSIYAKTWSAFSLELSKDIADISKTNSTLTNETTKPGEKLILTGNNAKEDQKKLMECVNSKVFLEKIGLNIDLIQLVKELRKMTKEQGIAYMEKKYKLKEADILCFLKMLIDESKVTICSNVDSEGYEKGGNVTRKNKRY